jgi:hypothetical protein
MGGCCWGGESPPVPAAAPSRPLGSPENEGIRGLLRRPAFSIANQPISLPVCQNAGSMRGRKYFCGAVGYDRRRTSSLAIFRAPDAVFWSRQNCHYLYNHWWRFRHTSTALAVTAMLATSAVAKTQRTKGARVHPGNSVVHLNHSPEQGELSYCHFHLAHTDPDPQVRLNIVRDCRDHELSDAD